MRTAEVVELNNDYYRNKFLSLIEWLKHREEFYDLIAYDALDKGFNDVGKQNLSSLKATHSARMWIRNHVLLPEKESE